ncbi:ankyrin [Obba rivulosa]|uniref:Ankyrin n=1 Tax=Obba rivulosa TaxID=1052685 RepID=A0A8E2DL06_9APHY|nr:ankyrin [Obba rivulosa]
MQGTGGFVVTDEMRKILSRPGLLKAFSGGQRLRNLYRQQSTGFDPQLLDEFALDCYLGFHDKVKQMVDSGRAPDLTGTETPYDFGYATLLIAGAQRAIHRPAETDYPATLKFLLDSGAPPNIPDIVGHSALQHATMNHMARLGLSRILLEHGADPNHRNRYGEVALLMAFQNNQYEAVDLLMGFGADLDIPEADGHTPAQVFLTCGPQVTAAVRKWMRRRAGEQAPMDEKKCDGCRKTGISLKLCSRCHAARYCTTDCQRAHWKAHKPSCHPFDASNTVVVQPRYKDIGKLRSTPDIVRQMIGIETGPVPKSHQRSAHAPRVRPDVGKALTVKVQVPFDPFGLQPENAVSGDLLVYTKKRDFVCMIVRSDDPVAYDRVMGAVRMKGVGGAKAYFPAELLSKEKLVIKVGEVLAEQPF